MIMLRIDDQTYAAWSEQAAACGLSVEDWLKFETGEREPRRPQPVGRSESASPVCPADVWAARLEAFARRHRPTGFSLNDSRESIYD